MKTIYIDVLIVLNIYVNFFLIKATARLTHAPLKTWRLLTASSTGSLFSLTILLPGLHFLVNLAIKLVAAFIITAIAFGLKNRRSILSNLLWFYFVNFIFGGIVMALYNFFRPGFMAFSNATLYIDFSLLSLIIFTAVAYFAVTIVRFFLDKGSDARQKYRITIRKSHTVCTLSALADTGNSLVDMFSGKPVIICQRKALGSIISPSCTLSPENAEILFEQSGIRFLPFSTVSDGGLLPVFTPEEVVITNEEQGSAKKVDVLIGISENEIPAVFNPGILC